MNRRRFVICSSAVSAAALFGQIPLLVAQETRRPMPPTNLRIIERDDYDSWLAAVREAAEDLAEENDAELDEDATEGVDREARETLLEKGYKVRPMPPMDLRAD